MKPGGGETCVDDYGGEGLGAFPNVLMNPSAFSSDCLQEANVPENVLEAFGDT